MVTILKLHFKDSLGKDRYIKIAKPKKGLDKETVQKAMQLTNDFCSFNASRGS